MTLKTSLVITGDTTGAVQATEQLTASLERVGTAATGASAPAQTLDQVQIDVAKSARDASASAGVLDDAQRKGATGARELAQATEAAKTAEASIAATAREATSAQQAYGQSIADVADQSTKLSTASTDVVSAGTAVAQQLADIATRQATAATGSAAHKAAIASLTGEFDTMVAQVTSGGSVYDAFGGSADAIAAALQAVSDASGTAAGGIDEAATSGAAAGVDLGGLGDSAVDLAGKVEDTGGKFGAMAAIIAGPVGIAVGFALNLLGEFIAAEIEASMQLDNAVEALKANAEATDLAQRANAAYRVTIEGVTVALKAQQDALDRQAKASGTAAEQANIAAKNEARRALRIRETTAALLANAIAQHQASQANVAYDADQGAGVARALDTARVTQLQADLAVAQAAVAQANSIVQQTRVGLADEAAKRSVDPIAQINKLYDDQEQAVRRAAIAQAKAGKDVTASLTREIAALEKKRQLKLDDAREDEQRATAKPKVVPLGDQIDREQAARLYASAQRYTGLSENNAGDRDQLTALFKQVSSKPIDPKITAWCAAFVNAVLATNGLTGTGQLNARSFLGYGEKTDSPTKGDIVVSRRGTNAAQGHVGFYQGTDDKGRVLVLGGNTGDKVGTAAIPRSDVLGFRRAPSAADGYATQQKAQAEAAKIAADALKQQQKDLDQVTARYLPAVAAAKDYADELARINALAASFDPAKIGSGLSPEQAEQARAALKAASDKRMRELTLTPEAKAADDARKSIDGLIASLGQEAQARATLDPVQRAMIQHQDDLAKLTGAERAEREASLSGYYAQAEAMRAVDDATKAAAQAQAQFRDMALDAFDAIVIGGDKAGDVIQRLAQTIASAAIEAAVLGTGPLAALLKGGGGSLGTAGGGVGGLASQIAGLVKGASIPAGGTVAGVGAAGGAASQAAADLLGKATGKSVGDRLDTIFGGKAGMGKLIQNVGLGYGAASLTGGNALTGSIGGILGGKLAGSLLSGLGSAAGPIGSIVGGLLGGVVGKLFAGKAQAGGATVSASGGEAGVAGSVGSDKTGIAAGKGLGGQVASTIAQIVAQLGGTLGSFNVSIGKYKDDLRVNTGGKALGGVKGSGATGFGDDENAAVSFAVGQALAQGAVTGVSAAVAKALASSTDVEKSLKEALKVQDIELMMGGIGATVDKAFRDFEATAKERVRVATTYGFDVLAIEKRNAEDRTKLATQLATQQVGSLQTLIDEMTRGSLFEGSAMDRITEINKAIAKARTDMDAGVEGAADTLATLYQQRLSASKEAYGTTGGYAADRTATIGEAQAIVAATNARIAKSQGGGTSDPALVTTNAALATSNKTLDELADQNARMVAAMEKNNALLEAMGKANDYSPRMLDLGRLAAV